jgi:hypothetical protein
MDEAILAGGIAGDTLGPTEFRDTCRRWILRFLLATGSGFFGHSTSPRFGRLHSSNSPGLLRGISLLRGKTRQGIPDSKLSPHRSPQTTRAGDIAEFFPQCNTPKNRLCSHVAVPFGGVFEIFLPRSVHKLAHQKHAVVLLSERRVISVYIFPVLAQRGP